MRAANLTSLGSASGAGYAFRESRQSAICGQLQPGNKGHRESAALLHAFAPGRQRESATDNPDKLDKILDGLNESRCEMHADFGVTLLGVVELRFGFIGPDNGQTHRLGRPALTCSHDVPMGGSFSQEEMRRSSSSACSALSVDAWVSKSSQSASISSNFSAGVRRLMLFGRLAIALRLGSRPPDVKCFAKTSDFEAI